MPEMYTVKAPLTYRSYERTALSDGWFFGHRFNSYRFVKKVISIEWTLCWTDTDSNFSSLFENKALLGGRVSSQSPPAKASRRGFPVLHASAFFDLFLLLYELLSW
jgi:hypothetical protein